MIKESNFIVNVFKMDAKKLYREIGKSKIEIKEITKTGEVEEFRKKIWNNEN